MVLNNADGLSRRTNPDLPAVKYPATRPLCVLRCSPRGRCLDLRCLQRPLDIDVLSSLAHVRERAPGSHGQFVQHPLSTALLKHRTASGDSTLLSAGHCRQPACRRGPTDELDSLSADYEACDPRVRRLSSRISAGRLVDQL